MTTLEDYLATKYRSDRQEIESLNRSLKQAALTFDVTFSSDHWPYKYSVKSGKKSGKKSQGTLAMVLCATGKLVGKCKVDSRTQPISDEILSANWKKALKALIDDIDPRESPGKGCFRSTTFGASNAMTLSHVAELQAALGGEADFEIRVKPKLADAVKGLADAVEKSVDAPLMFPSEGEYRPGPFIMLRLLRACRDLGDLRQFQNLRQLFESGLHDQLSFSTIPDSRFDPADLLFCLEGLLLCAAEAVDATSFQRILDVLAEKQNTSAHWRPSKPFMSADTGAIMLPLSIECANSFIRSIAIMDRGRTYDLFASKSLPLLHRFWNWLQARSVRFKDSNSNECVGWHSEHINDPDLVHIWDTSQVVEFMIAYRTLLFEHVARTTLDLSGVKERRPKPLSETLPDPLDGHGHTWGDVKADREPILGGAADDLIYSKVEKFFVAPRDARKTGKPNFSMLLYGPPGTGKSTLAELLADALEWRMMTVTVSDFLGSGGAMVEARAKAIFQMLEAQSEVVILFDEIDSFLLDRDSKFYRDQETLFQFLTPGMLTKINDLRSAKQSIFIIATNYANRIDPAIKRIGRIDKKLLLLPPNLARRKAMIVKAWALENKNLEEKSRKSALQDDYFDAMARAFCYLGWNDLQEVVKDVFRSRPELAAVLKTITKIDRSTGPAFYGRRFPVERPFEDQIREEVEWLYLLADEVGDIGNFKADFKKAVKDSAGDDPEGLKAIILVADELLNGLSAKNGKSA